MWWTGGDVVVPWYLLFRKGNPAIRPFKNTRDALFSGLGTWHRSSKNPGHSAGSGSSRLIPKRHRSLFSTRIRSDCRISSSSHSET